MAKKKTTRKSASKRKKTTRKKSVKKKAAAKPAAPREPEYMVQIADPKGVRRDVLEALRDIIIFMQGYEKFRRLQEEKVETFLVLKNQVRELSRLVGRDLPRYFPKGKLKGLSTRQAVREEMKAAPSLAAQPVAQEVVSSPAQPPSMQGPLATPTSPGPGDELDELETQLNDIERQLQNLQ